MCNSILIDLINWFLIGMGAATLTAMIIMPFVLYRQHKEYKEFSARINDKISNERQSDKAPYQAITSYSEFPNNSKHKKP